MLSTDPVGLAMANLNPTSTLCRLQLLVLSGDMGRRHMWGR